MEMNEEKKPEMKEEVNEADAHKIIKDLAKAWKSEEDIGKALALLKGLAYSKEPVAKDYMKQLDAATTSISNKMMAKKESVIEQAERAL